MSKWAIITIDISQPANKVDNFLSLYHEGIIKQKHQIWEAMERISKEEKDEYSRLKAIALSENLGPLEKFQAEERLESFYEETGLKEVNRKNKLLNATKAQYTQDIKDMKNPGGISAGGLKTTVAMILSELPFGIATFPDMGLNDTGVSERFQVEVSVEQSSLYQNDIHVKLEMKQGLDVDPTEWQRSQAVKNLGISGEELEQIQNEKLTQMAEYIALGLTTKVPYHLSASTVSGWHDSKIKIRDTAENHSDHADAKRYILGGILSTTDKITALGKRFLEEKLRKMASNKDLAYQSELLSDLRADYDEEEFSLLAFDKEDQKIAIIPESILKGGDLSKVVYLEASEGIKNEANEDDSNTAVLTPTSEYSGLSQTNQLNVDRILGRINCPPIFMRNTIESHNGKGIPPGTVERMINRYTELKNNLDNSPDVAAGLLDRAPVASMKNEL